MRRRGGAGPSTSAASPEVLPAWHNLKVTACAPQNPVPDAIPKLVYGCPNTSQRRPIEVPIAGAGSVIQSMLLSTHFCRCPVAKSSGFLCPECRVLPAALLLSLILKTAVRVVKLPSYLQGAKRLGAELRYLSKQIANGYITQIKDITLVGDDISKWQFKVLNFDNDVLGACVRVLNNPPSYH